jgi:hypothetical protein
MAITLTITAGPCTGTKIRVPRGQVAHVGRTRWADHSLPEDARLADDHFIVDYQAARVRLQDISGGLSTRVNGEPVVEIDLHSGDHVVAGLSTFSVLIDGEAPPAKAGEGDKSAGPKTAEDYCQSLKMGDAALELLRKDQPPMEYFDSLVAAALYADAIRFLAFWLPKPAAVAWGVACVEQVMGDDLAGKYKRAAQSAAKWAAQPDETNRRAAEAEVNATNFDGPASFLAAAAFWSGGSIVPPEMAVVPPAEGLTAQAVYAALVMTGPYKTPLKAQERYRAFLQDGRKRAEENEKQV